MTELNLDLSLSSANQIEERRKKPTSRWLRGIIALVLSAVFPGLGQLYNRQPMKGLWMATALILIVLFEGTLHTYDSFSGFIAHLLLWNGGRLLVLVDACRTAWIGERREASYRYPRVLYSVIGGFIFSLTVMASTDWFTHRFLYVKAFRVPSESMCPTICDGDRIIASTSAYRNRVPERGELIIFNYKTTKNPFIKRVVAIEGDLVISGPGNIVLINGKPLARPDSCGKASAGSAPVWENLTVERVRVPKGSHFVVGDNLDHSLDSRIAEFGFVTVKQLIGKPLFIYWSPSRSRIGCAVH